MPLATVGVAVFTIIQFVSQKDCDVPDNIAPDWALQSFSWAQDGDAAPASFNPNFTFNQRRPSLKKLRR
ncbi:MAG: hypothetical protein HC812_03635 [Leptolyngbya sp. RL_3_1]|nr:hypothetical protein [Leptolyngbya sp. RL_3_1]